MKESRDAKEDLKKKEKKEKEEKDGPASTTTVFVALCSCLSRGHGRGSPLKYGAGELWPCWNFVRFNFPVGEAARRG